MEAAANGTKPAQQSQAITPTQQYRAPAPLVPENLTDAWRLSEALARSTVIPAAYQNNPGNILAAIMLAQELKLSPMLVMREVYFVNDRPSLYAELKIALVMRDADCEYFICTKSDGTQATFETKRRGQPRPQVITYTLEEAKTAGLYPGKKDDSPWRKYPANMLRWRAAGWLCDLVYPDKVLGLKTREEMEDEMEMRTVSGTRLPSDVQAPPPFAPTEAPRQEATQPDQTATEQPKEEPRQEEAPAQNPVASELEAKISMAFTLAKSRSDLAKVTKLIGEHPDEARKTHWREQYNIKSRELA